MASKAKINIPKVCQENWLDMSPDEKVRFCNLCQKNVFDHSSEDTENKEIACLRYNTLIEENKTKNSFIDKVSQFLIKKK